MRTNHTKLPQRLTRYSLAAGAAGLTVNTDPADAAIVVYDNGGAGWTINDGESLTFRVGGTVGTNNSLGMELFNNTGERGLDPRGKYNYAMGTRLDAGTTVEGTINFAGIPRNFTSNGSGNSGWTAPGSGYLGIVFHVSGDDFYGWMDITLDAYNAGGDTITVSRYAVETTPDAPIVTGDTGVPGSSAVPEPGTLALLALGATGLAALRRRAG